VDRPDKLVILFLHSGVLVGQLGEDFGKSRQADPQFGLKRKDNKSQVSHTCQRAEVF
jgi:hypothetical protein